MAELLIAANPDENSRLPLLLRVPLPDGDLLFRTAGTWPQEKALFAYPVGLDEWPDEPVIVAAVPLRSCQRRGAAIDVIADLISSLTSGNLRYQVGDLAALPRAAVVVEDRYSQLFRLDRVRPAVVADGLAELQIRWPNVGRCPTAAVFAPRSGRRGTRPTRPDRASRRRTG